MLSELMDHFDMGDPDELALLAELRDSIRHNPRNLAMRLDEKIYEAATSRELCPECFSRLTIEPYTNIYIMQGETFRERTTRAICPECGWRG